MDGVTLSVVCRDYAFERVERMDSLANTATNLSAGKKLSKSFLMDSIINGGKSSKAALPYEQLAGLPYYSNLGSYLYTMGFSAQRYPPGYLSLSNFNLPQNTPLEVFPFGGSFEPRAYQGRNEKCKPIKPIPMCRTQRDVKSPTCRKRSRSQDDNLDVDLSGKYTLYIFYFLERCGEFLRYL